MKVFIGVCGLVLHPTCTKTAGELKLQMSNSEGDERQQLRHRGSGATWQPAGNPHGMGRAVAPALGGGCTPVGKWGVSKPARALHAANTARMCLGFAGSWEEMVALGAGPSWHPDMLCPLSQTVVGWILGVPWAC